MNRSTGFGILRATLFASASAVAVAVGCSSGTGPSEPSVGSRSQQQDPAVSLKGASSLTVVRELAKPNFAVLRGAPEVAWRPHGGLLLPKPPDGVALHLSAVLPAVSGGTLIAHPITSAARSLSLTPVNGARVPAEILADGRALYPKVHGSADLLVSYQHDRLIQSWVVRDAQAPDLFVWKGELGGDTRLKALDEGRTLLVDQDGRWVLTVEPATIVDAKGRERTVPVAFDDGYARLIADHRGLEYPFVVNLAISAPAPGQYYGPPPTTIKGRVMVLLDTSGSMLWGFGNSTGTLGDSDSTAVFCDNALGTAFACNQNVPCTIANGGLSRFPWQGEQSRMAAAKAALQNVVNAHTGLLDFGLARYAQAAACGNGTYCCTPATGGATRGRCRTITGTGNGTDYPTVNGTPNVSYSGGCGTGVADGGRVLVSPSGTSGPSVIRWVDYTEDFCSDGSGIPRNPELRANGGTPLARSVGYVRENWYRSVFNAASGDPNFDPLLNCRPYVLVVMTDGADTCGGGGSAENATTQVQQLTDINATNPPFTYVLGMGNPAGLDTATLNAMIQAGGSGLTTAPIAQSQDQIEAAFADIVSRTVKFEVCNRADDNCNDRYDEGLSVYQECNVTGDCAAGSSCDHGRCTCTGNAQCSTGYSCGTQETGEGLRLCRPACSAGLGACHADGVKKCGFNASANGCCINDNSPTCHPLVTPPPSTEICNGIDDDCDGFIDEGNVCGGCVPTPEVCDGIDNDCDTLIDAADPDLIGMGQPCGSNVGECCVGTTVCDPAPLLIQCRGGRGPATEQCNGLDDDCNGVVDGMTRACYTGPTGTRDVGICHAGAQNCTASPLPPKTACEVRPGTPAWGACVGEQIPRAEVCNGLDDDCNGPIDDNVPDGFGHKTGDSCCLYPGKCGVGVCTNGKYACVGKQVLCVGGIGPTPEICDHGDNDCNGVVDDLPGKGTPCLLPNACAGTLECDYTSGSLKCEPKGNGTPELCNGLDDDCDGSIDEEPDVLQDPNLRGDCNVPVPPNDKPPCKPGHWICRGGVRDCTGSVGPGTEICDGKDNDCDGLIDTPDPCPGDTTCLGGECAERCRGEFECPGGRVCINGRCVSRPGSGGAGGAAGKGGGAGQSGSGGAGTTGQGGDPGAGGSSGTGAQGGTGNSGRGGSLATGGLGTGGNEDTAGKPNTGQFGVATGGGGCACSLPHPPKPWSASAALGVGLVWVAALGRRRRSLQLRPGRAVLAARGRGAT